MSSAKNPLGLAGISFVEITSPDPQHVHALLTALGFSRAYTHATKAIDLYEQNAIRVLLNREPTGFAADFRRMHGPSICSMGWRFADPEKALAGARSRGAAVASREDHPTPAITGIGGSLIYFLPDGPSWPQSLGFVKVEPGEKVTPKGFLAIDHLTNNVEKGKLGQWASFYEDIFGFTEIRSFEIQGERTGLTSLALRSPCGTFSIPINQADEAKSQINEYLERYHGPGIQHVALLTNDILGSLDLLKGSPVQFLDIEPSYYEKAFDRVPSFAENRERVRAHQVLVDGDADGYLLQVFTKDLLGPIFLEIIQRRNHLSFGEGNFGALFRSIERDQTRRGIFEDA